MQHQHQVEEVLANGLGQNLTSVGVEDDARPASLARRGYEKSGARSVVATIDPQCGDTICGSGLDLRSQLTWREMPLCAGLDLPALGVERPGDLTLEAVKGTGDTHDGQHQACTDAEEPVQLEDDFLEHDGATLALTHCDGRPLYMGIIFITIHLRVIYASTTRPGSITYRPI